MKQLDKEIESKFPYKTVEVSEMDEDKSIKSDDDNLS